MMIGVVVVAAGDRIVADAAIDQVVAVIAVEGVVAAATEELVVFVVAVDDVVERVAGSGDRRAVEVEVLDIGAEHVVDVGFDPVGAADQSTPLVSVTTSPASSTK